MTMKNKVILYGDSQRAYATKLIAEAPEKAVVTIAQANRTNEQNAKVWTMLGDISKHGPKPNGKMGTPDAWKGIVMYACGHECQFEIGLDGEPFPVGLRSSQLTISQLSLIHI